MICDSMITTMQFGKSDERLCLYDSQCNLKYFGMSDEKIVHNFGKVYFLGSDALQQMLVIGEGEYVVATCDREGKLKQFSLRGGALVQDFGKLASVIKSICG
jgi:hypothetical protein